MRPILSCPELEAPTGPDHDGGNLRSPTGYIGGIATDALGTYDVLFESDDLLEALARTSGMYGVSPNGHGLPQTEAAAAGGNGQPPGPPDGPADGDYPSDDHNGDGSGGRLRRCEHGQSMLSTDDLTGWWGAPEPGTEHPVWWCPTWCARTDTDNNGNPIEPTEWVHRSQPCRIRPAAKGTTTTPDGAQTTGPVTFTVRAEKHPIRPVRFILTVAIDGTQHTCTMTLPEARQLYGFHDVVTDGLTGHRLVA